MPWHRCCPIQSCIACRSIEGLHSDIELDKLNTYFAIAGGRGAFGKTFEVCPHVRQTKRGNMNSTTANAIPAPESTGGRWKDVAVGVAYLMIVGVGFTAVVALASALFASH